jgi:membrane protease YdiL (CAAX protease family)
MKRKTVLSFLLSASIFCLLHFLFYAVLPNPNPNWVKSVFFGIVMGLVFTWIQHKNKKPGSNDPGS